MDRLPDPRPAFRTATEWVTRLMAEVGPDRLDDPTPCSEYDVRTLCSHLVGTARRAVALAEVGDVSGVDPLQPEWDASSYAAAAQRALDLWSDDAKLAEPVVVPWGTVPGAGALWGYVNEQLVHGWDLAQALGAPSEADPAVVAPVLAVFRNVLPAERDADTPFAAPVPPRPGAGLTEQLANWSGRSAAWRSTALSGLGA